LAAAARRFDANRFENAVSSFTMFLCANTSVGCEVAHCS
jgi:hypothetical protein